MVTEKVVKRTQIGVGDVIELKDVSSNIIVAGNKRNDNIPALWELMVRIDTMDRFKNTNIGIDSELVVIPGIV